MVKPSNKLSFKFLKTKIGQLKNLSLPKQLALGGLAVALIGGLITIAVIANRDSEPPTTAMDTKTETDAQAGTEEIPYTLKPYQGDVYAIKKPEDWQATDNLNAIETTDPQDPLTGVSGSIVMGAFGEQSPEGHIRFILDSIGATNISYEHTSNEERVKERWTGLTWVVKTQIMTFTNASGDRVKAKATAGVLQGAGQYVAMVSSFQTTPDKWDQWAPTLERIMQTIQITDGSRVAGHDKVRLPTAADVKSDSSPLMEAWEYRNRSESRTSQDFSDAIMGHESGLQSPSTGTNYTLPLNNYDPTVGGYRNPDNRSEILVDTH